VAWPGCLGRTGAPVLDPTCECLEVRLRRPDHHSLYYTRDVTFQEDQSRIRHNLGVFGRLRSFANNILPRHQTSTFNQDRYAPALDASQHSSSGALEHLHPDWK